MKVFGDQQREEERQERIRLRIVYAGLAPKERGNFRRMNRGLNVIGWTHPLSFVSKTAFDKYGTKARSRPTPHGMKVLARRRAANKRARLSRRLNRGK